MSWPEAYYVTQLPGWDVHVVTASQDSDEIYGYEDFAIGWFDTKQDAVDGAKDVLIRYWRSLHSEYDQQRWEELFDISAGDPEGWPIKCGPRKMSRTRRIIRNTGGVFRRVAIDNRSV